MQTKQGAVLESWIGVDVFVDENADRLGDVVATGARRTPAETLAEIDTHAMDQSAYWVTVELSGGTAERWNETASGCELFRSTVQASDSERPFHRCTVLHRRFGTKISRVERQLGDRFQAGVLVST